MRLEKIVSDFLSRVHCCLSLVLGDAENYSSIAIAAE